MLQASPQKIDLQRLAADFALQLGHLLLGGATLSITGKRLDPVVPQFPLPTVQHIRVHLAGSRHLSQRRPQF
jgi:hypothetical protein